MVSQIPQDSHQPDLAAKVAFLSNPDAYPGHVQRVDVVETHMSWVFLTDNLVHKLKKPVKRHHIDLTTVEARSVNCNLEVCLNRRLAPNVYLGIVPLTLEAQSRLNLYGEGQAVDWLVKMRRLPADRMLDRLIKEGTIHDDDVQRFTETLERFYVKCHRPELGMSEYRRRLREAINDHREDLLMYLDMSSHETIDEIAETLLQYLSIDSRSVDARVASQRIVEGHGDLRPEHICLDREVSVFDCLEFSEDLRTLDIADELAFLTLECERLNDHGHDVAQSILSLYSDLSGDVIDGRILAFYKASRALLRAKLAIWHLDDRQEREHGKWRDQAKRYLDSAACDAGKL